LLDLYIKDPPEVVCFGKIDNFFEINPNLNITSYEMLKVEFKSERRTTLMSVYL
jgi:hypothetical protein